MTKNTITVFKGDGIGPEITDAVLEILEKAGANLTYEIFNVGEAEYERNGALIPAAGLASFEKTHVLLKSPITTPVGKGFRSLNVTLRTKYDLYANIRPAKSNEAVRTPFPKVDLITFRENTEDLYVGVEEEIDENTMHATKIITREKSERICRAAFRYAEAHGRKKVTCVHKANIMKLSDGLFRSVFYEVAKEFPAIEADDKMVDAVCMMLVMHPENFDILVMPNLYGDIVSDLTSGLIGGLGLLPSSNIGDRLAMFEAVHGSAPDIAGKGIANPTAFLWSACMMLEHLGDNETAARIRRAVDATLKEAKSLTPDLGGTATTHEYTKAIVEKL
ncbi:isocitrate/isopropylmalate dehydrogenase family protein [Selenomonas sputigena]|jgi:isocitrate dehydrogenase|uniref:Isocitrate dehydrogenase (NAD(+)) n=1 Tax=Selenomonas sputigena (strain ATCC 35185 / DSM 20758 / CCUG 44933 / VPI D19B-28) TaxID=546271 RepID=C9LWZ6_SELS3|nr:isocitrate/isopropylmalate family dehydrogenase [Selenomonas sputigena]AEC01133.1 Isocitrate dehydrogenase (NAD(+)) [Selenomonas sputigena ATCC 35185]EEX76672.1 putative isocitrate dehydrogenase, NAD-dependent [Selenomonas sputigena ATCC 35185]